MKIKLELFLDVYDNPDYYIIFPVADLALFENSTDLYYHVDGSTKIKTINNAKQLRTLKQIRHCRNIEKKIKEEIKKIKEPLMVEINKI